MANLPANPGEALWIGAAGGKNHYNVGIGFGTSGGDNHTDFDQAAIEDGYSEASRFRLNATGNVEFRVQAGAGKTSTNTAHPRSELRELTANGGKAAWDGRSGTHTIKGRSRIIEVTGNRPWICFFQAHGSEGSPNSSDLFRVQTEGDVGATTGLKIVCRRTPPSGGSEIVTTLRTGYSVGTWIDWEASITAGRLVIKLDGVTVLDVTGMGQILCYWKMGCYLQDNPDKGASATAWGGVEVERGSFETWHTGYPQPTTPVFTGGTDPGGGPGTDPGTGADTQAPTSPTGLTVTRDEDGAFLDWNPSTDNVGVHHYNVYRSGAGGGGGGGGGVVSTVGKTVAGTATTLSSADKIIASKFTAGGSGTLTAGHARAWLDSSGSTEAKLAVYEDSSGAPGDLLAESDEIVISTTAEGVRDFVFSGADQIEILSGTSYWIALLWDDPGTPSLVYGRDNESGQRQERSGITYGSAPDPFGTPTAFSGPIDVWIDLNGSTAGGGGTGTTTDPVVRSSATAGKSANSNSSISVSKPSGLVAGDYLLALAVGDADIVLSTMTASGFSTLASQAGSPTDNYPSVKLFGKVATSTDVAASTFSFGFGTTGDGAVILAAITADTYDSAVPVAIGSFTTTPRTSTTLQTAPSRTGVVDGLLLALFATDTNNTTESYPSSGPSGFTRVATAQGTPHYAMAGMYSKVLTSDGATGTATVTPTGAGSTNGWVATSVMVNPKVTAGGDGGGGSTTTATLGKTSAGASSSASSANKTAVSKFTATANGTLDEGHAHAWLSATGSSTVSVVVYADSAGAPGALLAQSDTVALTITADAVTDFVFSGANRISIVNGTDYWVGLAWTDPGTPSINLGRDNTASARQETTNTTAPNPFGTPTAQSGPVAVWVVTEETTGGGGGGQTGTEGYSLLATVPHPTTSYLDASVAGSTSGQTLGVGGIPRPTAGPGVVLVTADSSSVLNITTDNRIYDGGGKRVPAINVNADGVTVQNFVIDGGGQYGYTCRGSNNKIQNCDIYGLQPTGDGDMNAISFWGANGFTALYNTIGVTDFLVDTNDPGDSHTDAFQTWNNDPGESSSNVTIAGNYIKGPGTGDPRFIHQGVMAQGKAATDGGGGGTGDSTNWIIDGNTFEVSAENQIIKLEDIDNVVVTRNVFIGTCDNAFDIRASSSNVKVYSDNDFSDFTGSLPTLTSGDGPATPGFDPDGGEGGGGVPVEYSYVVTAVDAAGNESGGGPGSGTPDPPDTEKPTTPTNLTAEVDDGRIILRWDPSTDNVAVRGYQVWRDEPTAGTTWVYQGEVASTVFVDTEAINGLTYSYIVSAIDTSDNQSLNSAGPVSATAVATPIGGVALLPAQLDRAKIEVSIAWGADLAADPAGWLWSDVTQDVRFEPGISTSLGRNDESSTSNPANITLVLDNTSGDYSLGTKSRHYPFVRRNTPVRVRISPSNLASGRILIFAFADGFTPGWDALTGKIPVVTLSASGSLRRMSQGDAPIMSSYKRVMSTLASVKAYWPFEEGASARYAPAAVGPNDMTLVGRPDWGSDSSFNCSGPLPVLKDGFFTANVASYTDTGNTQVRFLISVPDGGLTDGQVIAHIWMTGTIHRWDITYEIVNGVEALGLFRYNESGGTLHSSDLIGFAWSGKPQRISLELAQSGSNIVWTISGVPPEATSTGFVRDTIAGRTAGIVEKIEINPHGADIDAAFGHLTVENAITSIFSSSDALSAQSGESITSDTGRLFRLCAENRVPIQLFSSAGPLAAIDRMGPQLVAPLLTLLRECETANQGQLWDGRNVGLSYTTRRRRTLGTIKLTIDAAAGDLAGDFSPVDDDQRNRNRMTVSRLHGVTYTYEDVDGPLGTDAIGIYDDSITVNTRDDASIPQFARWFVQLGTVEGYRYPSVTVDLAASPHLAAGVLDIVPGERIQVVNLDDTLAGFTDPVVDLIVEGIAHEVTPRTWRATFRCSPFAPWETGLDEA